MNISGKTITLFLFLCGITVQNSWTQILSSGLPLFNPKTDTIFVPRVVIENPEVLMSDIKSSTNFKDNKFAHSIDVSLSPKDYGVWIEKPQQNKKIWLLAIKVENAASLNLILRPFYLEEGCKLFFYDSLQTNIIGAITARNNKTSGVLPVSGVSGDLIYCEIQVPIYKDNYGNFIISKIGAGYKRNTTELKSYRDDYYGTSDNCNVNVNCYDFKNYNTQKRAVCRIIYEGTTRCSGTLINNLENNGTPYVLTAGHCINTQEAADEAIFDFNFESPGCKDSLVKPQSVSGAELISAGYHVKNQHDSLDFSLLKLTETPPLDYKVYYSGWNATGDFADSTFTIHHPQGDIKKISLNVEPIKNGSFGSFFLGNTHWAIVNYEVGKTEGGSSGSGLVNYSGEIIGTLSGGSNSECGNSIWDQYQQFKYSFNYYNDKTYQLKHWLDPLNRGSLTCEGYDPSFYYRIYAQKLINYDTSATQYSVQQEKGWGYLAGHNYQGNKLFFEKYEIDGSKYLVGAGMNLAQVASTANEQYVYFQIREGGAKPGKVIYEKRKLISDYEDIYKRYPDTLFVIEFDSTILIDHEFYYGYEIAYQTDTFALKTLASIESNNTACTFIDDSWGALQLDGKEVGAHLAQYVYAFDFNVTKGKFPDTNIWGNVRVYPNPIYGGTAQIYFKEKPGKAVTVKLFSLDGQLIKSRKYEGYEINAQFNFEAKPGVYIMQIWRANTLIKTEKVVSL